MKLNFILFRNFFNFIVVKKNFSDIYNNNVNNNNENTCEAF